MGGGSIIIHQNEVLRAVLSDLGFISCLNVSDAQTVNSICDKALADWTDNDRMMASLLIGRAVCSAGPV